jgi:hypothetical protein
MNFVNAILTLYIWGIVCLLLFFLLAIGRFYESKSGRRSHYRLFVLPALLFITAAMKYVFYSTPEIILAGDFWVDLMRFAGALILSGVGLFLLNLMIGGRS